MFNIIFVTNRKSNVLISSIGVLQNDSKICNIHVLNYHVNPLQNIKGVSVWNISGEKYNSINKLLQKLTDDVIILDDDIGINKHFLTSLESNYDPDVLNLFRTDIIRDILIPDKRIGMQNNFKITLCIGFNLNLIQEIYSSNKFKKILDFNYIDIVFKPNIRVFKHKVKGIPISPVPSLKRTSISRTSKRVKKLKKASIKDAENKLLNNQIQYVQNLDDNLRFTFIIPFMYNGDRYPLFEISIKNLYNLTKDYSNIEIAVHETAPERFITDNFINKYDINYLYTKHVGLFDIAWNYNYFCKNCIDTDILVFFDADLIIDSDWIYNLLSIDKNKNYIAWNKIVYIGNPGFKHFKKGRNIKQCRQLRRLYYESNSTTGGINIIPMKIFKDVKGWPEDFRGLGYGCVDCSMVWKLTKIYGKIETFPNTIYHLPHRHKTSMTDKRFSLKKLHKSYNKQDWLDYIDRIEEWGVL